MSHFVVIQNLDREQTEKVRIRVCDTFSSRLRGLMFRSGLPLDEGILLVGDRDARWDSAIHMLFVPFDLAVFWISSQLVVVDKLIAKAWRPAYVPSKSARFVLEMHPSRLSAYEVGNKVKFIDD